MTKKGRAYRTEKEKKEIVEYATKHGLAVTAKKFRAGRARIYAWGDKLGVELRGRTTRQKMKTKQPKKPTRKKKKPLSVKSKGKRKQHSVEERKGIVAYAEKHGARKTAIKFSLNEGTVYKMRSTLREAGELGESQRIGYAAAKHGNNVPQKQKKRGAKKAAMMRLGYAAVLQSMADEALYGDGNQQRALALHAGASALRAN